MKRILFAILMLLLFASFLSFNPVNFYNLSPGVSAAAKMDVDEVVRKHLEAIGATESRASSNSRIILGDCKFSFQGHGTGTTAGKAVIASQGNMILIGMNFPTPEYPHERLGYDGHSVTAGFIRPGVRTVLGDFIRTHDVALHEGLLGGALSAAWPLLDLTTRKPKLEYSGTQKVNGREAHVLTYTPHGGSDFDIRLFFDSETFQHVRTEYSRLISARMGRTIDQSSSQRPTRYKMIEDFSDFKKEGNLTLPHSYKLQVMIEEQADSIQMQWELFLTQYSYNRRIPPESFNVEAFTASQ
ncbi:MAG: hypothetical protein AUG51_00715 [Acidobacteria bacterium 13_1_20CM_3_53_8]|nr:MAG: hypothetical protein AUG51_00715 [Acidobacteria bacterium 13_1_20CM_3_53_8]